jgi:ADP-heptose:LPS heptosyltransferase
MRVERPAAPFDDGPDAFLDTAAVIANLDLVITSDTAVAHLAGAMGRAVIVALKYVPDWRWLLDRGDSPWYPKMQLVRQHRHGDWDDVFARIEARLRSRSF